MALVKEHVVLLTAEDLAAPGVPEKFVELVEGVLVTTTPAGNRHNRVGSNLTFIFRQFCSGRAELDYCGDNYGFYISRNPDTVLSPDVCLYRARPDTGTTWNEFAPEIVVEVLSPSNTKTEMAYKRHCFFEAGSEQFWLLDPEAQSLQIYHRDGRVLLFQDTATVEGEGIATGLQFSLAELFAVR